MYENAEHENPAVNEWRRRVAAAPVGWLPPAEEREEIDDEVLRKCLGIDQAGVHGVGPDHRLELVSLWFAGREREIPYEEWGLERPSWIAPA
jgi:hypothetical protein